MMQFYFLSIVLNAASGGALLLTDGENTPEEEGRFLPAFLWRETPRLVLGALTVLTALFKLLSPLRGDIPILGDLVPAAAGLAAGFLLVFEYYRRRTTVTDEKVEKFSALADKYRKFAGFAALASSALHFLFPGVLFL
ncbi:MAG: hypothetical protein LBC88_04130 [Spirochaetaceae bacterium]|jgi:hypothetical protein|nr:hypothetical protein [Spirochaetaceae bacterium]